MNSNQFFTQSRLLTQLVLVFILITTGFSSLAADISVDVSRNPVHVNESVDITFTADGVTDGDPDFSPLENDFEILSQSSSSQVSMINGAVSRNYQWIISVIPKQTGGLIIPSIAFGSDRSPASMLQVNASSQQSSTQSDDIFVEVEATPLDPYVQAQVVYTVRVYHRVGISQAELSEPEIDNAVVEQLQKDSKYRTQRGQFTYDVYERRYAIFPQRSGNHTIAPIRLNAQIVTGRRNGGFFFSRDITRTERFVSKSVALNVKPVPAAFTGKYWLPASSMELTQTWSADPAQAVAGEPMTRTMVIQSEGLMKSQLPVLSKLQKESIAGSDVKIYPDQPVLTQAGTAKGILSRREEKIAIIPEKSGVVKLPAMEIPWWNTQTDRMETARIDETVMNVKAASGSKSFSSIPQSTDTKTDQNDSAVFNISSSEQTANDFWKWASLGLGLGWLLTLIAVAYYLHYQRKHATRHEQDNREQRTRDQRSRAGRQLKQACQNNQAADARTALLNWAQARWPENPPTNLATIGRRLPALHSVIEELEQSLYNASAEPWDGSAFWEQFKTHRKHNPTRSNRADTPLEPLFKT
ncbi:MAG TPA: protein BatD [Crenotrichaceae bacterium]|nr:protein BatD [Crenotrichaceae bacterium]